MPSCIYCDKSAYYGYPKTGATTCKYHKEDDMKWVHNRIFCPCDKSVTFGYKGDKPVCCNNCKKTKYD
jgi:hypothetical protein